MLTRHIKILTSVSALALLSLPAHAMNQAQQFEAQMMEQTASPLQVIEQTLEKESQEAMQGGRIAMDTMEKLPGLSAPSAAPSLPADQVSAMLDQPETVAAASADKAAEAIRDEVKREMAEAASVAAIEPAAGNASAAIEAAQSSVQSPSVQSEVQAQAQNAQQEMSAAAQTIATIEPSAGTAPSEIVPVQEIMPEAAPAVMAQANVPQQAPVAASAPMSLKPEVEALPQFSSASSEILNQVMQDDEGMNYYSNNLAAAERKVMRGATSARRAPVSRAPATATRSLSQKIARGNATRLKADQALNNIAPAAGAETAAPLSAPNQMKAITVEQPSGAKTTIRSNLDTGVVIE